MRKYIFGLSSVLLSLIAITASGVTYTYWDPEGAVSAPSTTQLTGTWVNTGGTNWSASSTGGANIAWVSGGNAVFCSGSTAPGAFTVTVSGTVSVAGLFNGELNPPGFSVTLNGGTLSFPSGAAAICNGGSDGYGTTINSVIAGTGAQMVIEGDDFTALYGVNTYTGGTQLGFAAGYPTYFNSIVYFNNTGSFGTGTITLTTYGSGAALVVGTTSAVLITNAFNLASTTTNNFVGSVAGVTYSGPWTLNGNLLVFETGNTAGNIDTISGPISGTAGFSVSDVGTLILTGTNTFSGTLSNVSPNVLKIGGAGQLGSGTFANNFVNGGTFIFGSSASQTFSGVVSGAGAFDIASGSALNLTGASTMTGAISNSGTLTLNGAGTLGATYAGKITNTGTLNYNTSATETFSGVITGSGVVAVSNGSLTLSGANTYSGITAVSNGLLTISSDGNLGTAPGSAVANQLTLNNSSLTSDGLHASATVSLSANRGVTLGANGGGIQVASSFTLTIPGIIAGTGALTQNGPGTLTLSGANTYGGITTVSGGILNLANSSGLDTVLGTAPGSPVANQLALSGGTLEVSTANVSLNVNRGITLTGANTLTNNGKDIILPDTITGTGSLTKTGANAAIFGGANSFSGNLSVLQGTAYFAANNCTGTGNLIVGPAIGLVTLRSTNAAVTITNNITVNGGTKLIDMVVGSSDMLTFSGQLSGSGGLTRGNGGGPGFVVLSGSNTNWSGGLTNQQGGLIIDNLNALGTGLITINPASAGVPVTLQAGVPLSGVNAITNAVNIASTNIPFIISGGTNIEFSGPVNLASVTGCTTPTISNLNSASTIFSGVLSGPAGIGLTAAGTGVVTLNGADTYTGTTTVSSGTLTLGSSGSISSSPAIAIGAGAMFDVSVFSTYAVTSTSLTATGSNGAPAAINGGTGLDLSIPSIALNFNPATFTGDVLDPALVVSNAAVTFNGNTITVNNTAATPLSAGTYALIQVASGNITGVPATSVTVTGKGLAAGATASISVTGGTVNLVVIETPTFSALTASQTVLYGSTPITLTGKLSGSGPVYPTNGETITVTINGNAQTTTINDSMGDFSISYTAPVLSASGTPYTISYAYAGDSELNAQTDTSTALTVSPAPLTVIPSPQSKTYGQTVTFGPGSGLFTTTPLSNGETIGTVTLTCVGGISSAAVAGSPYAIVPSAATGGSGTESDYAISYVNGGLTINPLTVILTGTNTYNGTTNATNLGLAVANALPGDDVSVASGSAGMNSAYIGTNILTSFDSLTLGGTTGSSYSLTGASGTVVVIPLPVAFTGTRPYDGTNDASSNILSIANDYDGTNLTFSGDAVLADSAAGAESISDFSAMSLGGAESTNYTLTNATGSVTITGVPLTITANPVTKTYGTAITLDPTAFIVSGGPLVGSETVTSVTMTATPNGIAATDPAGIDAITPSAAVGSGGFLEGNYNITYATSSLTVNPLTITLTGARPYDGTATADFSILSISDVVGSDDVSLASGSANLAGSAVGSEAITSFGTLTLGGTTAGNYTLVGATGSVTIGTAPLTITANPQSATYGTAIALGSIQFSSLGLQPGDTIGSVTLSVAGYASNSPIGGYAIVPSAATGGTFNPADYSPITYNAGTLTVSPLTVILTGTQVYNSTTNATNFSLSVSNAVGGDDVSVASGSAGMASADIGTNALTSFTSLALGGTTGSNYTLTGASGAVIVTTLPIVLTGTRAYDGTAAADFSILSISDVAGSDDVSLASGSAVLAGSAAGSESITDPSGLALGGTTASNYTLTGATGSVTITTIPLTITANPVIKTYGTAIVLDPTAFTVSGGPLVGSETVTSATMTATPNGIAATDPAGVDTITPSAAVGSGGFLAGNYNITYATNSLTVNPLTITLTGARPYDGTATADFSILAISDVVGSDDVNLASGSATLAGSTVGPEAVTSSGTLVLGGTTAANYTLTGTTGSVAIGAVALSITANPQSATYGTTVPLGSSAQFSSLGLQPGDSIGSVTLSVAGYASNSPIGAYAIVPSAATGGTFNPADYSPITYNNGTLTVSTLPVILTGAQVYNSTTNATNSSLSVSNALGGDDVTVASGSAGMASADIGTNALTSFTSLTLGGTTGSNYTLTGASGAVVVTTLPIVLTGTRAYDGTAAADSSILSISDVAGSDDVSLASGSAVLAGSAAGSESITDPSGLVLGGTTASNYTLTGATGSVTITTIPLTITANPVTKTYGTAITLDPTAFAVSGGPLVGSETVTSATMTATPNGIAATDPAGIDTITPSAAIGSGGFLAGNYNITYATNSLTVNPLTITLTGARPYDGTATADFSILSISDVVGSDDVSLASGSATLAGSAVGSEAIVSPGSLALGGLTAGNYTLTGATGSVTISNSFNTFTITSSALDNTGTNLVVCWQSVPGVMYNVLTNSSLTSTASWIVSGSPISATNTTTCYTLSGVTGTTNVFVIIKQ